MGDLLKALFGTPEYVSRTDTTPDDPDPDPNDTWAFTDPDARDEYACQGKLKRLAHDILYEVMRAGAWQPEELEYKSEVRRLLQEGAIADKGTYWYRSPHPTVYRAKRDGSLSMGGRIYCFRAGDDLVFQCRMERDEADDDPGPVLISRLQSANKKMLCGDMPGAMKGME
jgi:hypothetical protein